MRLDLKPPKVSVDNKSVINLANGKNIGDDLTESADKVSRGAFDEMLNIFCFIS